MSGRYRQQDFARGQALQCRWDYTQGAAAAPALVLPDACVDLLWDGSTLSLAGPDRQAQYAQLAPGSRLQGLRFAPGVASQWLGLPLHALTDQRVALRELGVPRLAQLSERIADHGPAAMGWLAARILSETPGQAKLLSAVHLRLSTAPSTTVARLADELGVTERTLLRHCDDAYGYGPKLLARILRLQRFLDLRRSRATMLVAALDAGYYDAAQLAGDTRRLTGLTPTQLVAQSVA
ncbi:helix-turn-helix domain-containing protein [Aquimonas sp.]|uniref:helix-turn-helix domain-containing protein n=1 Tax=Aquimonas sp. TaxID=1872588 RepID=UPI0037BF2649